MTPDLPEQADPVAPPDVPDQDLEGLAADLEAEGIEIDPEAAAEQIAEAAGGAEFGWWSIFPTAYAQQRDFILGSSVGNQLFCGGRGTGKTWAGSLKALFLALRNPGRSMPGGGVKLCPGAMLGRTALEVSAKLEANFVERVAEFRRATGIELIAWYNAKHKAYTLINGAVVYMLPYGREDTLAKIRGYDLAWAWIDEIMFAEVDSDKARGIVLATLRYPLAAEVQLAITSSPDGVVGCMSHFWGKYLLDDPDYFITAATVFDNPHVDDDFRRRLKSGCTPQQWAAEGLGQLVKAANVIYAGFSRDVHVIPWEYDRALPVVLMVDWGDNWAWSGLANVVDRLRYKQGGRRFAQGTWVVFDERPMADGSSVLQQKHIGELVRVVRRGQIGLIAADKAVKKLNNWLRGTYGDISTFGVKTLPGNDLQKLSYGIGCVRWMLNPPQGPPRLYFADSLDQTIERKSGTIISAMGAYGFKRIRDETGEIITTNKPEENTPPTHGCDGLRYGVACSASIAALHGGSELPYARAHSDPKATPTEWHR